MTGANLLDYVFEVSKARLERPGLALCLKVSLSVSLALSLIVS